jgi:hypothetical protein
LPSIAIKKQLCSKKNCKCSKSDYRHGSYCSLVTYNPNKVITKGKRKGQRGSYEWKYLGKNIRLIILKLKEIDPDLLKLKHIQDKLIQFMNENPSQENEKVILPNGIIQRIKSKNKEIKLKNSITVENKQYLIPIFNQ